MNETPIVELRVSIDGKEVFGLFENSGLGCDDADAPLVLAALSEALTMVCGIRPRKDIDAIVSVQRATPAAVLSIVKE